MTKINFDLIRDAAETKYGSYIIELDGEDDIVMLNPAALSSEARAEMLKLGQPEGGEDAEESEAEQLERLAKILDLAAETPSQRTRLRELVSPRGYLDLGLLGEVVKGYMEDQKVGESSAS